MPSLAHNTRVCKSPGNNGSFHSDRKRPQENPGEGAGSEIAEDREEGGDTREAWEKRTCLCRVTRKGGTVGDIKKEEDTCWKC